MAKHKKKRSQKKRKNQFTPINKHKRDGSKLTSEWSDLNLQMIEWERDLIPEHLWIDLLAEEYKDVLWFRIYNEFLDKLEECLTEQPKTPLFGFISDFTIPSDEEKEKFISNNKDLVFNAFFKPIGKILSLYPKNPASWLVLKEWIDKEKVDFEEELNKLSQSVSRLMEAKDLYAGHIRALPLNRLFKHNKIFLLKEKMEELAELIPKYPGKCTEEEKYYVQSFARTTMNQKFMIEDRYKDMVWSKYFWRHNYDLVPCVPLNASLEDGDIEMHDKKVKEIQEKTWKNSIKLMKYLDKIAMQYKYDLYDPMIDQIKLGLFSRIVRLYISFVSNPFLWTRDLSCIMLRCLGETTIIFHYLILHGTNEDFKKFHDYAIGKEKLLMLHIQDTYQESLSLESKDTEKIAKDIGGDFHAEITDVELKGWTKKDIRTMAHDTGLQKIYKIIVDPSNADIHGSWSSIRKSNLVICRQTLHRFHRIPKFYEPPVYLGALTAADSIYLMAKEIAVQKLGFPKPDETLLEISEVKKAMQERSKEIIKKLKP